jgi:hypothetical protein
VRIVISERGAVGRQRVLFIAVVEEGNVQDAAEATGPRVISCWRERVADWRRCPCMPPPGFGVSTPGVVARPTNGKET